MQYRVLPGTSSTPLGIAIYTPETKALVFKFKPPDIIAPEDQELVAASHETFARLVVEFGAEVTFKWMSDQLSNVVYVEGPFQIETSDVKSALDELYAQHCS
jgi:hypothetical protein